VEEKNGKRSPIVSNPYNCVVFFSGCQIICASGAISHKSKKVILGLSRKLIIKSRFKD
jgi:hypothetical protein